MKIAVVTFDGFNEIDSFVAAHILNRVERAGWKAEITAPAEFVTCEAISPPPAAVCPGNTWRRG